jgi:excisionase family DNA binding protein
VVTARKQVGASSTYGTLRSWQPPRSSYDQLRQAGQQATPGELEVLLRTTEVARRLQVSARTVLAWAQAGKLPSILTPGGHRRYPAQGVEQVLQTMTAAGEPRTTQGPSRGPNATRRGAGFRAVPLKALLRWSDLDAQPRGGDGWRPA